MTKNLRAIAMLFVAIVMLGTYSCSRPQEEIPIPEQIEKAAKKCGLKVSDIEELTVAEGERWEKYTSKYRFFVEQPIDHTNPEIGTFRQRVVLMHCGFADPMLLVTEGYTSRGSSKRYSNELSDLFNTNIIEVEHRYFSESIPFMQNDSTITDDSLNWDYMTAKNAAADLHNVNRLFKKIYKGKWIATGISKGGQTTMFYTTYYPEDIDISVPYVGPLCFGVEDGRHEPFLANAVGTKEQRDKILAFQTEVLKRRKSMEPLLLDFSNKHNYTFRAPFSEIYDLCVLEFPFAFWQWGRNTNDIPDPKKATDKELLDCLLSASGPDYFAIGNASAPFFVQAAKELGYYGYDTEPFKKYLTIESAKGYLSKFFVPAQEFVFDDYLSNDIKNFLETTTSKMLFVYGEYDPWSSVMPEAPVKNEELKKEGKGRETMCLFIDPKGSHRARIKTLPDSLQKAAIGTIERWLAE